MTDIQYKITISEMAKLHGISRQTLIHYDKIGLFKPEVILKKNGYRYYRRNQIPILREICFLRNLRVSLNDIKSHLKGRTPEKAALFFAERCQQLEREIQSLQQIKQHFLSRLLSYQSNIEIQIQREPILNYFSKRKVIFVPWESAIDKETLHYTLMRAWRILIGYGYQPSNGFGSIIRYNSLCKDNILEAAGSYVALPKDFPDINQGSIMTIPAGYYFTMLKIGMPYEKADLEKFLVWMEKQNYTPCGDIIDACIFDSTFYSKKLSKDYCQLQVPIRIET